MATSSKVPGGGERSPAFHVLAVAVGLFLLMLAAPRLVAAVIELPGDRVVFAIRHGEVVTDEALVSVAATRATAAGWIETARGYRERSAALLELASRRSEAERATLLDLAERAALRGLTLAPIDPYSWARLAAIAWSNRGDARSTIAALRASFMTGGYEPQLTAWRLRLMFALWPQLGLEDRVTLIHQVHHLWRDDPEALIGLSRDPEAHRLITAALESGATTESFEARRRRVLDQPTPSEVAAP